MVKQNENEWENYLDSVLFVYRTSKQASAKISPFFLLYGREPRLPMQGCIQKIFPGGGKLGPHKRMTLAIMIIAYIYTSICLLRFALFA